MEAQKTLNRERNPEQKKSNSGSLTIPDFKLYYRAMVTKSAWYWLKNRHAGQWNRLEDTGINPCSYSYVCLTKAKAYETCLIRGVGKTAYPYVED
jgi:hypothetical protein